VTDQLPSKEQVSRLRIEHSHGLSDDAADEIERLQAEVANISEQYTNYHDWAQDEIERARRTAEYWKAEHFAGNVEIDRLRTALTGISTCSTCEACRGAARLALGEDTCRAK
jgi:hypothetical protein